MGEERTGGGNEAGGEGEAADAPFLVRAARAEDAPGIAAILAESFPALYQAAFGRLSGGEVSGLLTALYRASLLSLETTRVAERAGQVVGLAILHVGEPIGRGSARAYWRTLRGRLGLYRAARAFFGGISTNAFLNRRIPSARNLVYVEALAVRTGFRGGGVGTGLLRDASAWARVRGRARLSLHVLRGNEGARRLYARLGFRPVTFSAVSETRSPLFGASSWGAVLMSLNLEVSREP